MSTGLYFTALPLTKPTTVEAHYSCSSQMSFSHIMHVSLPPRISTFLNAHITLFSSPAACSIPCHRPCSQSSPPLTFCLPSKTPICVCLSPRTSGKQIHSTSIKGLCLKCLHWLNHCPSTGQRRVRALKEEKKIMTGKFFCLKMSF